MDEMIIFDIDGTLANNDHRVPHLYPNCHTQEERNAYTGKKDWAAFYENQIEDPVYEDVARVLHMYQDSGTYIQLLTGRSQKWETVTLAWLKKHHINYDDIWMRPNNNRIDDHILKVNQIQQWQSIGWNIIGLYDDRKRICDAVREHGITVFQMAAGDF